MTEEEENNFLKLDELGYALDLLDLESDDHDEALDKYLGQATALGLVIPEQDPDWTWFNVEDSSKDLFGRILVLDFFTYCCINCMHMLPELEALEQEFHGLPVQVRLNKKMRKNGQNLAKFGQNLANILGKMRQKWPVLMKLDMKEKR